MQQMYIYASMHLIGTYEEFKHNMHQLFPMIIDTKQLSFQLKRVCHEFTCQSKFFALLGA